jgi:hypothetical protein
MVQRCRALWFSGARHYGSADVLHLQKTGEKEKKKREKSDQSRHFQPHVAVQRQNGLLTAQPYRHNPVSVHNFSRPLIGRILLYAILPFFPKWATI